MTKAVTLILAHGENGVIGNHGELPWPMHREDMRRFREATLGKSIVMGRKTYDSLGQPLKWRQNIVISRSPKSVTGNVVTAKNMEEAIKHADQTEVMVIGGAMVYALAMPYATRILLTRMHGQFAGDVYFSIPFRHQWRETRREEWRGEGGDCDFLELEPLTPPD